MLCTLTHPRPLPTPMPLCALNRCTLSVLLPCSFVRRRLGAKITLSPRDLLAWAHFINRTAPSLGPLAAYVHGAYLTLLDGIGLGLGMAQVEVAELRAAAAEQLAAQLPQEMRPVADYAAGGPPPALLSGLEEEALGDDERVGAIVWQEASSLAAAPPGYWGLEPFYIPRGPAATSGRTVGGPAFDLRAPTTGRNAMRVLRALQLAKPVLLEGSPGVGKTSLVAALAAAAGHTLVRINLRYACHSVASTFLFSC